MTKEKERKKLLDPYTQMSTSDLLKYIEERHSDTPEAQDLREDTETKMENAVGVIEDIEKDYLKEVRGEHARYKGKPKSYSLSEKEAKEEATELIYRMVLESIRQHLGEDAVEVYKKKPHMITTFLNSKGIDFYKLRKDIVDNRRNFRKLKSYQEFKKRLPTIEELVEEEAVEKELVTDQNHYDPMLEKINKIIGEKTGLQIKYGTDAEHVIHHYKTYLSEGKFSQEHLRTHEKHFKKYKMVA